MFLVYSYSTHVATSSYAYQTVAIEGCIALPKTESDRGTDANYFVRMR